MSRSIFGWSLPPGCGQLPGEGPEPPCALCGHPIDSGEGCACLECPHCGEIGCVTHLDTLDLIGRLDAAQYVYTSLGREYARRCAERPVVCPKCKREEPSDLRDGENYCSDCDEYMVFKDKMTS